MGRAAEMQVSPSPLAGFRWTRFTFWLGTGAVLMIGVLFAWSRTEEFLIKDDRFRIPETNFTSGSNPHLTFEGVRYASPAKVADVFAEDYGRSLFLAPIQVRRNQLLAIDWVEEATVSKIWPNSLRVSIRERTPVAFLRLPNRRPGLSQFGLIDSAGYILHPSRKAVFTLPVISGIQEADALPDRRLRVRRVLGMMQDIGTLTAKVSEVNAADANDLIVSERVDDGVINLMLGDENYRERLNNFLANYSEIKSRRPDVRTLDLRVDGVITAVGVPGS